MSDLRIDYSVLADMAAAARSRRGRARGRRLRARRDVREWLVRGSAGVAAAYVVYALLFIAGSNVKSPEVRTEYRALHPLLRVASSALILLDPASVVTDAARSGGDHARMGLPP